MRLYILSDHAAPHTRRWAKWFAEHGHEVHVVSLNPQGLSGYEPVTVHVVWRPRFGNNPIERALKVPIVLARLGRLVRRYPPDLVHAHSAGGYAWLAMLSRFRPYVVTPWGTDLLVDAKRSKVNALLTGLALRRAALVTTDGNHFLPILASMGVPPHRTLLHTFGVDLAHFSPGAAGPERERLGIAADTPVVISTRTLNPVHDVETFVLALPLVRQKHPKARFVIVGGGAEEQRLRALVAELGVSAETVFTGMVEEDRMRELLRAADVYVSTSLMDAGLAGSTAEAMATALPVIQTDNSDNAYWTPEGVGGLLVPERDPEALADAIGQLLDQPGLRASMGAVNVERVAREYNRDIEMARVEDHYRRLAAPTP